MSLPVLVASTLLLFLSLPITLSTPFDGNTVSVTTLLPTGYCLSSGQGYLVAITGNNTQCECVYVGDFQLYSVHSTWADVGSQYR